MSGASWWAVPLLSGGTALAGVVVGQLITMLNERKKVNREDTRRWHRERLELYYQFVEKFDKFRDEFSNLDIADWKADKELYQLANRMRLISNSEVFQAAIRCCSVAVMCRIYVGVHSRIGKNVQESHQENPVAESASRPIEPNDTAKTSEGQLDGQLADSITNFVDITRKELGVPGQTVPNTKTTYIETLGELREAVGGYAHAVARLHNSNPETRADKT